MYCTVDVSFQIPTIQELQPAVRAQLVFSFIDHQPIRYVYVAHECYPKSILKLRAELFLFDNIRVFHQTESQLAKKPWVGISVHVLRLRLQQSNTPSFTSLAGLKL